MACTASDRKGDTMIIPWQDIAPETLESILESVVLREGTDYGEHEKSLSDKVADLYTQLKNGDIVIVWSELHETLNIMPSAQFRG